MISDENGLLCSFKMVLKKLVFKLLSLNVFLRLDNDFTLKGLNLVLLRPYMF